MPPPQTIHTPSPTPPPHRGSLCACSCQEQENGWRKLTVKPSSPQAKHQLLQLQRDRDAAVVVLTLQPPQQQEGGQGPVRVTGLVSKVEQDADQGALRVTGLVSHWDLMGRQDIILVRVRPWCGKHEWGAGPCCQVCGWKGLRGMGGGGSWRGGCSQCNLVCFGAGCGVVSLGVGVVLVTNTFPSAGVRAWGDVCYLHGRKWVAASQCSTAL